MSDEAARKIIHIDMDAFFASVEQRDNPALRGRPVVVGRPERRGVVAAASYEARTFGVRSAMPSTTALKKCPELIFVPPRFDIYRAISRQIRDIFADYTTLIEPLSLDEAYLDVTHNLRGLPSAWLTAKEIRQRILTETALTASAGISYNKFLAKLASEHKKPNGQFAITPDMGAGWVTQLAVKEFHGIGPVTAKKMEVLGIVTGADLREKSLPFLVRHFGKSGSWYHEIAQGMDKRPVNSNRERKSIGAETTFPEDQIKRPFIESGVRDMAAEVWALCQATGIHAKTVTIKVKWQDFQICTRSRTLDHTFPSLKNLVEYCLLLLRSLYPLRTGIRLVGVTLSHLTGTKDSAQTSLDFGEASSSALS